MKTALRIILWASLATVVGSTLAVVGGQLTLDQAKLACLVATAVWFAGSFVAPKSE